MKRYIKNKNLVCVYTLAIVLGLCVAAFFSINTARAEYDEDFDYYTIGDINGQGNWTFHSGAHMFLASTEKPYTGTSSLKLSPGAAADYYLNEPASTSQIFSFYIWVGTSSSGTIVIQANASSTWLFKIGLELSAANYDIYYNTGTTYPLVFPDISFGQWQKISIWINYRAHRVSISKDGFAYFGYDFWDDTLVVSRLSFQANLTMASYIDSLTTELIDYGSIINFTNPLAWQSYFLNSFSWGADWSIGLADILAYWDNDVYTLIDYTQPDGQRIGTQESGLIKNFGHASQFDPSGTQTWTIDNPLSFPNYLGQYTATASLVVDLGDGTTALLDNNVITFTIATGTEKTIFDSKDAYCSDLCEDLDVSITSIFDSVTCAGRYVACYMFVPSTRFVNLFSENFDDFKARFPANVFYDITSTTRQAILETGTESPGVPLIFKRATGTRALYTQDVLTASSVPNLIGAENNQTARDAAGALCWLIIAGVIALQTYLFMFR
jgi:hypothetical protein